MKVKILTWEEMSKLSNVKKLSNGDLEYRIENDDDEIDDRDYVSRFTIEMEKYMPKKRIIYLDMNRSWFPLDNTVCFVIDHWMIDDGIYKGE